ncbi:MAG: 1-acyl-sn-glycerol-3-phosphate acyltransferase, partial [Betaproteobacteria bacterium]|nr:1-acyl-sn-glycerol-3-phosphate acyltransferase [Betaproteobacteria bacterium]
IWKSAGWVDVRIGPAIDTAGRSAAEVNAEAKAWIDNACAELASNQGNP